MERFNRHLEAIDAALAKVTDVRAKFEQRRRSPLLKKPMVSKGDMLSRGEMVRWETEEPRKSTMLVGSPGGNGQVKTPEIRIYYPDDRLVEVYETGDKARELMGAVLPRLSTLRSQFTLSPLSPKDLGGAENNPHLLGALLEPKSGELRRHIESVRVLIDDSIPAAIKVIITNAQSDTTEISFSNVRVNVGVTAEEMALRTPSNVRVSYPMRGMGKGAPESKELSPSMPATPVPVAPKVPTSSP